MLQDISHKAIGDINNRKNKNLIDLIILKAFVQNGKKTVEFTFRLNIQFTESCAFNPETVLWKSWPSGIKCQSFLDYVKSMYKLITALLANFNRLLQLISTQWLKILRRTLYLKTPRSLRLAVPSPLEAWICDIPCRMGKSTVQGILPNV